MQVVKELYLRERKIPVAEGLYYIVNLPDKIWILTGFTAFERSLRGNGRENFANKIM